jgi:hypothetical protein
MMVGDNDADDDDDDDDDGDGDGDDDDNAGDSGGGYSLDDLTCAHPHSRGSRALPSPLTFVCACSKVARSVYEGNEKEPLYIAAVQVWSLWHSTRLDRQGLRVLIRHRTARNGAADYFSIIFGCRLLGSDLRSTSSTR